MSVNVKSWSTLRLWLVVGVLVAGWSGTALLAPAASAQEEPLVFCSDIAYPPMEFFEGSEPLGADIDIGNEIAARLGREAEFSNIGFDGIIAALLGNQCDAIISSMNVTPERAEQVDFVPYLEMGQSLVVPSGNPLGITSLETLCGHAAGAQVGTTFLEALEAASAACEEAGEAAINITGFPADTDGILALQADRVDVHMTDSPVAAYYIGQAPETLELGGQVIDPILVGIAFNQDNTELRDQVQAAVDEMYADGAMLDILEQWQLQDFALPDAAGATPEATPISG
ncbi:MAG: ABC transporter substrate-binding protein [Thermomicrobiales bacterium]